MSLLAKQNTNMAFVKSISPREGYLDKSINHKTTIPFLQPLSSPRVSYRSTRNCVYETLCPKPLACPPSCSPVNLFTILLQLTKSEATRCNRFQDIFIGSFRCPNLQRAFTQKNANAITKKKIFLKAFARLSTYYPLSAVQLCSS